MHMNHLHNSCYVAIGMYTISKEIPEEKFHSCNSRNTHIGKSEINIIHCKYTHHDINSNN